MDINGLSDPFCRLTILPTGGKVRECITVNIIMIQLWCPNLISPSICSPPVLVCFYIYCMCFLTLPLHIILTLLNNMSFTFSLLMFKKNCILTFSSSSSSYFQHFFHFIQVTWQKYCSLLGICFCLSLSGSVFQW